MTKSETVQVEFSRKLHNKLVAYLEAEEVLGDLKNKYKKMGKKRLVLGNRFEGLDKLLSEKDTNRPFADDLKRLKKWREAKEALEVIDKECQELCSKRYDAIDVFNRVSRDYWESFNKEFLPNLKEGFEF